MTLERERLGAKGRKGNAPVERALGKGISWLRLGTEAKGRYTCTVGFQCRADGLFQIRIELPFQVPSYDLESGSANHRGDASPRHTWIRPPHLQVTLSSVKAPRRLGGCERPRRPIAFDVSADERRKGDGIARERARKTGGPAIGSIIVARVAPREKGCHRVREIATNPRIVAESPPSGKKPYLILVAWTDAAFERRIPLT